MDMVDILLEELDEEVKTDKSFDRFLEDINIDVLLEQRGKYSGKKKTAPVTDTTAAPAANGTPAANTTAAPAANGTPAANTTAAPAANGTPAPKGNGAQGVMDNVQGGLSKLIETVRTKCSSWAKGTDGFVTKHIGKMKAGLDSLTKKIQGNEKVKLVDGFSTSVIEFFRIPKQVFRAGDDLEYVLGKTNGLLGGVFSGLTGKGNELKKVAQQGLDATNGKPQASFLQSILNMGGTILKGIMAALSAVGAIFGSLWASIKKALGGGQPAPTAPPQPLNRKQRRQQAKQQNLGESTELVFFTLDEEVDYLLS